VGILEPSLVVVGIGGRLEIEKRYITIRLRVCVYNLTGCSIFYSNARLEVYTEDLYHISCIILSIKSLVCSVTTYQVALRTSSTSSVVVGNLLLAGVTSTKVGNFGSFSRSCGFNGSLTHQELV